MGRAALPARLAPALLLGLLSGLPAAPAPAQTPDPAPTANQGLVVRDGTLGADPAREAVGGGVDPYDPQRRWADYLITPEMGELRGTNLFHSFWSFGVGSGETATFTGPDGIEHVISRVTGPEASPIDGTLRSSIPGADVWLFNPNGIVFGEGAQLDVKGSFHAATADYVGFEGGLERFHGDPSRPSVLATARPAAFGFLPESAAASLAVDGSTLAVPEGETLELVGRGVSVPDAEAGLSLTGAKLLAPGGHVGLETQGEVKLTDSLVDVGIAANTPGTISIRGGQIVIQEDSKVVAENESPVPGDPGVAGPGSISVEAGESLLVDASLLSVSTEGAGNAGTIHVKSPDVAFQNGPRLDHPDDPQAPHRVRVGARAETTGSGDAGRIEIEAPARPGTKVEVADGAGLSAQTVGADASAPASGKGGTVRIEGAGEVRVADGGFVTVESWGSEGDAGRIEIPDTGTLAVDGDWLTTLSASSLASVSRFSLLDESREQTPARAGAIWITAESVDLQRGGAIESRCLDCAGGGGEIHITAQDLRADGRGGVVPNRETNARVHWGVGSHIDATTFGGEGDAGSIAIRLTGDLTITGGAQVVANSFDGATGNAGDVSIEARDVRIERERGDEVFRPSQISAEAAEWLGSPSSGDAGRIHIKADSLVLKSEESLGPWNSGITAHSLLGSAGTIALDVGSLEIDNGQIDATNRNGGTVDVGSRHGGTVAVNADSVTIASGGEIVAGTGGKGPGGTITVDADRVEIGSRGRLSAETTGDGNAGTINVLRTDSLAIGSGGGFNAGTSGAGKAGTINILRTGSLEIGSNGYVHAGTRGAGNAGTITVRADSVKIAGESASMNVGSGSSGADSPDSVVGNAGEIDVVATDSIVLTNEGGQGHTLEEALFGEPLPLFTGIFSATVQGGEGGSIRLEAPEITVTDGAGVSTATVSGGNGGTIDLLGDRILVANGGYVDSTSLPVPRLEPGAARDSGDAGSVTLDAREWIEVSGHSDEFGVGRVASLSLGSGAAGAVTLTAPRIAIDGGAVLTTAVPSDEPRERTRGGAIRLDAGKELLVRNGGSVDASTFIAGPGGSIDATAGQSIRVEGQGSGIASRTGGTGVGGSVLLRAPQIEVRRGGEVSAESAPGFGPPDGVLAEHFDEAGLLQGLIGTVIADPEDVTGNAGSITLAATKLVHLDDGDITTSVGVARGGDITIDPIFVILENGSRIVATAGEGGTGGGIRITTDNFFQFPGSVVSAVSDTPELSGTVEIHSPDVNLAGTLTPLPSAFLDAASLMRERCAARRNGERSGSFAVRGPGGIPSEPDGWLRAPVLADAAGVAATPPAPPALFASLPGPLLAHRACP